MKIVHVSKKYPQALGGDAVVVFNLCQQQQAVGHQTVVVTSNCDEIAATPGIYKFGLRDTPAQLDMITPKRIISLGMLFFKMFAIVRKEHPDVIHTHSIDLAFVVSAAARFYNVPTIHTFHIVTFYDASQSWLRRKVELWLAKKARPRITTVPNVYDAKVLQSAGLQQTVLLPNGVDAAFWQTPTRTKKIKDFVFVAVGRLEKQKGYEHLIRAVALLAHTLPVRLRVIVIGAGSEEQVLRQLIRSEGLEGVVTLAGRKSPAEVRNLFSQADAATFPSLYETTPLTLLEAWAAHLPVIASSVGILRDTPSNFNAAYVVPPGDHKALAAAMRRCVTNAKQRRSVAAKGNKEAAKYTWPRIGQMAEAIYKSAVYES